MSSVAPAPSNYEDVLDYFNYWPNKAVNIVALVLFSLATVLCLASTVVTRRWYMLIAVAVGVMEVMGFAFRLVMRTDIKYGYFVAMQCLLIIPPSFIALCQYITLAKVVKAVRDRSPGTKFLLKPALITWLYFAFEILSLALQGAGAGLSVSNDEDTLSQSSKDTGEALLITGLAFLVVLILCFTANAIFVSVKTEYGVWQSKHLTRLFAVLYASTLLLVVRNIFRLIEFADGWDGTIATNEKLFYSFDSLMVLLILFIFSFFHYGFFLNAYEKEDAKKASPAQFEMV